jgi:hypothetical protein
MKTLRIPFTLLCVLAINALCVHATHADQLDQLNQLATAKVISVEGTVTKSTTGGIKLNGRQSQVKVGDILSEGDRLSSSANSQVFIVFSNGSGITISENTIIEIAQLEQEPYNSSQTYEQLQADPSKSQTLLKLEYGQLEGHVKKLSKSSSFRIETPLGTAAIRGTRFSVSLAFSSNQLNLSIINFDGLVDFIGQDTVAPYAIDSINDDSEKVISEFDDEALDTPTSLPDKTALIISCSQENPVFNAIIGVVAAIPGVDIAVTGDGSITITVDAPDVTNEVNDDPLPTPEITPEDPGIIVVSPEDQG